MDLRFVVCGLAMTFLPIVPVYAQDAFPLGVWTDAQRRIVVRITPCGSDVDTFCGTVVQDNRTGLAKNQPGHTIIRDLEQGPVHWSGQAFDGPTRFSFTLKPTAHDRAKARLCVSGIFCMHEKVHRVSGFVAR
jgi:uncharacterized protein (DUF2147 family)